jgi:serine/threonine protein kinase
MTLTTGSRLGNYEILAPLGAGGMGEVYRARDTKLKREVALKVLPNAFAGDLERMARFQREAEILAALNHPNIAAVYGVEDRALIMELVEGDSPKGPMAFDEAWRIASQIAGALEYAHEKGIVHRDLKPANVKITPDGVVKLLDFGLAKAFTGESAGSADPDNSPTLTIGATQVGVILGTAAYMSPEQAKGKSVDKRADIWAFGVMVYELLTGQRLFPGEDVSDTLARVLTKQPDFGHVPAQSRRLLQSCLEKDPKRRLRDIGDVWRQLEDPPQAAPPARSNVPWAVAAVATAAALALGFLHVRERGPSAQTLRYNVPAPESSRLRSLSLSPDGRYVAIAAQVNEKQQLWLRPLDALRAQPMPGTEDATFPFWSPDSRYIGFFAQGKLKKIAASGGPAQSICDVPDGRGGSWNREGVIVFSPSGGSRVAIQQVPSAGGVPRDVTKTRGNFLSPVFLPDGHHLLYLVAAASENNGIYLGSLDGSENRRVLGDVSSVVFAQVASGNRAGHLLFIRDNTLMAQPFDAVSAQLSGEASPIAEGVSFTSNGNTYAPVTASENGVLAYVTGATLLSNQIAWFDRAGTLLGQANAVGNVYAPSISPDEKTIAFTRNGASGTNDIWLQVLAHGTDRRFTSDGSQNFDPVWSPDGDRIAFRSNRRGSPGDLYQKAVSGSGQDELLLATTNPKIVNQWSRDGQFIVYSELGPKSKEHLWVLPIGPGPPGDRKGVQFLKTEFNEFQGQISPDDHWMAYTSDESGRREVYVRPFPLSEGIWPISTAGGEQPRWRGDGKELFFVGADGKLMAVAVGTAVAGPQPSFDYGPPVPLFEAGVVATNTHVFEYHVTRDGMRFLVDTKVNLAGSPPVTVVVNWQAGLKK